jgi:hypothetical protein
MLIILVVVDHPGAKVLMQRYKIDADELSGEE